MASRTKLCLSSYKTPPAKIPLGILYEYSMDIEKQEPNIFAQALRHRRVFLKTLFFSRTLFRLSLDLKAFWRNLKMRMSGRGAFASVLLNKPIIVQDPIKKFLRQSLSVAFALLIVMSFDREGPAETGFTAEFYGDYIEFSEEVDSDGDLSEEILINEEGFILKPSPTTESVSHIGFTDSVKHTVVAGDTLSGIAALYGISLKTLLWENNISEDSTLKIGQTLIIPPLDGVTHTVAAKTETLSRIAKEYGVEGKLIKEHNNLDGEVITKGQKLFIPGGKKKESIILVQRSPSRNGSRFLASNTLDRKFVMSSNAAPEDGKRLIFPTVGKVTQGFRGGHYAIDIGNRTKPDVWAAESGIIIIAKGGCPTREERIERGCNGGYGNYIKINHMNGLETVYAHLETLYVEEGQSVSRGQAIGKMSNSGRVGGPTGIHVHFEVIDNGEKRNPINYL